MVSMRQQAATTVLELFGSDQRVAIVLGDISLDMFREAFERDPARALNVGIMEQTMVGVAAGFAMEGFHPIVHTITPFLTERAFEQLKVDFGYQGLGGLFISVGASYDYAESGATHHAPGDIAELFQIPGMQLLVPGTPEEVDALVRETYDNGRSTYVRTSFSRNASGQKVELGRMNILREGDAGVVIAVGPMLDRTLSAVQDLDVTVLYATSVRPFDQETLARVAGPAPEVICIEPFYEGTLSPIVASALGHLPCRLASVGVPRAFINAYGTPEEFDHALGLDEKGIRKRVEGFLTA